MINEHSPFTHFDVRAKRVMDIARRKSEEFNSHALLPEHLLLAVLSMPQGSAAHAVTAVCGSCAPAENVITEDLEVGLRPSPAHLPFTPAGKEAIFEAARQANLLQDDHIGTGHLLLGLLLAGGDPLTRRLSTIGVTYQAIKAQIEQIRRLDD